MISMIECATGPAALLGDDDARDPVFLDLDGVD